MEKRKENRLANFKGQKNDNKPMTFPPLYQNFRSRGHINPDLFVEYKGAVAAFFALIISVTEEDKEITRDICSTVHLCPPDFKLNN